jgi:hypothetical protein
MAFIKRAAEIFRDFVTASNPASGPHNPIKADIRGHLLALENAVNLGVGTRWVPSNQMVSGGGPVQTNINFGSGLILPVLPMDPTAQEFAFFSFAPPDNWDLGPLRARFYWAHPATTVNFGVRWSFGAASFGNDDPLGAVSHAAVEVTDIGGTTNDLWISDEVTLNPANTEVTGDLLGLYASRAAPHAEDNLAVDAYLIGVKILYGT